MMTAATMGQMPSALMVRPKRLISSLCDIARLSIENMRAFGGTMYLRADLAGSQQRMLPDYFLGREDAACSKGLIWRGNRRCHRIAVSMVCQTAFLILRVVHS